MNIDPTITWTCKAFDDLSAKELYAIMQLRNAVFVVEQNCVFQDADNKDQHSLHFFSMSEDELLAYARILPAGISYVETSIGRIVVLPSARKWGLGRKLVEKSIEEIYQRFEKVPIRIGAQLYLRKFYESFGFQQTSDEYLEDDILHIEMLLSPSM